VGDLWDGERRDGERHFWQGSLTQKAGLSPVG
jgi:hypothetical protein